MSSFVEFGGINSNTPIIDETDHTKKMVFDCSVIPTGTTRTFVMPASDGNVLTDDSTDILINKTLTDSTNNILSRGLWVNSGSNLVSTFLSAIPTTGQVLTAVSNTVAEWQTVLADVTGPVSSIDQGLVRFNGTSGKLIEDVGIRHYGALAADPSSPTPAAGDKYYNTVINHEMCYDGSRNKWLSVAILFDGFGVSGSTTGNTFFRRFNGMPTSTSRGPFVQKGTIIRIGYTNSTTVTMTYEVLVGGFVVVELASGGAASISDDTLNADFNEGTMSSRNKTGSSTASAFQSTIYYKLRA
jgi:hypothetical protein